MLLLLKKQLKGVYMSSNEKGFSLVEGLLLIIILLILGFAGFFVYNTQSSDSKDSAQRVTGDSLSNSEKESKDNNQESNSKQKRYEIPELGVSFMIGGTDTLIYKPLDHGIDDVKSVGFTTQGNQSINPFCDAEAALSGILTRAPKDKKYLNGVLYRDSPSAQVIGDYVYVYTPSQSGCLNDDENSLTLEPSVAEAIASTLEIL
jgi:type II secretory pathway pseudopilin PulG